MYCLIGTVWVQLIKRCLILSISTILERVCQAVPIVWVRERPGALLCNNHLFQYTLCPTGAWCELREKSITTHKTMHVGSGGESMVQTKRYLRPLTSTLYGVAQVQNLLSHSATSENQKQLRLDYYDFAAHASTRTDPVPFAVLFPPVCKCQQVKIHFRFWENLSYNVADIRGWRQ
jgi:hypothetical protein